jgi:predicted DNA-binding transcriptional regulator YafY
MEGYRLPPLLFNQGEAAALLAAEKFIGEVTDQQTQQYYSDALTKIRAILRSSERQALEVLDSAIAITQKSETSEQGYLPQIFDSLAHKRIVSLEYSKADGTSSHCSIEPIGCYRHAKNWYLVGFCRVKEAYRTFRLDRITTLAASDAHFSRKHISLKDYTDKQDQAWKNQHHFHTIEIAFTTAYLPFAERRKYYFGFVRQWEVEDTVHMTFLYTSLEIVARWILQFADQATIHQPLELRDRVKDLATDLYHHTYKNNTS